MADTKFKPGQTKRGGRKKGTPNKRTLELMEVLEKHDFNAAEELIYCYNEARKIYNYRKKRMNLSGAIDALKVAGGIAEDIAQFSYPKKKAVEHSGEVGIKTFADFMAAGLDDGEGESE